MVYVNWFANLPGMFHASLIATGLVTGVFADWFFRRIDGSRADRRIALGYRFNSLSESVEARLRNNMYQPDNPHRNQWHPFVHDLVPSITSAFITARKFGIWTPSSDIYQRNNAGFVLMNYLDHVGTLLKDGHFKQAKEYAQQFETMLKV
jgi:hypothetical protein